MYLCTKRHGLIWPLVTVSVYNHVGHVPNHIKPFLPVLLDKLVRWKSHLSSSLCCGESFVLIYDSISSHPIPALSALLGLTFLTSEWGFCMDAPSAFQCITHAHTQWNLCYWLCDDMQYTQPNPKSVLPHMPDPWPPHPTPNPNKSLKSGRETYRVEQLLNRMPLRTGHPTQYSLSKHSAQTRPGTQADDRDRCTETSRGQHVQLLFTLYTGSECTVTLTGISQDPKIKQTKTIIKNTKREHRSINPIRDHLLGLRNGQPSTEVHKS